MKKITLTLTLLISVICFSNTNLFAQHTRQKDTAKIAKNAVKEWLIAFDGGNYDKLKKLSADSTNPCHLQFIMYLHLTEKDIFIWSEAKWWGVQKKTIDGISGYMVTPSLETIEKGQKTYPNLPIFVYYDKKNWVVDIYKSEFSLIESDCPESP